MQKPEQTMGGKRAAAMATPMMALMPPPVKARDTATPEGAATQNPENKHHATNQSMLSKLVTSMEWRRHMWLVVCGCMQVSLQKQNQCKHWEILAR